MVAVPLPLSENVRPAGSVPCTVIAGAGAPVVTMVVLNGVLTIALADAALTIDGATCSDRTSGVLPTAIQAERAPA
jgi:hypothetical protein